MNAHDILELEWLIELDAGREQPDGCDIQRLLDAGYATYQGQHLVITPNGRQREALLQALRHPRRPASP